MKLFVAGVKFDVEANDYAEPIVKCDYLITLLPHIISDAKKKMGYDVVMLIVLHEYALTVTSIPKDLKKTIIQKFKDAIENYSNVIFIPGSFSYHSLRDVASIKKKISASYVENSDLVQFDSFTIAEKKIMRK